MLNRFYQKDGIKWEGRCLNNFPKYSITGIEKNNKVFSNTNEKFNQTENVSIIHDDIFNLQSAEKFDVILINYVLFYFNKEEDAVAFKLRWL